MKNIFLKSKSCARAATCPRYETEEHGGETRAVYDNEYFYPPVARQNWTKLYYNKMKGVKYKKWGIDYRDLKIEACHDHTALQTALSNWFTHKARCKNIDIAYAVLGLPPPGVLSTKELNDCVDGLVRLYRPAQGNDEEELRRDFC